MLYKRKQIYWIECLIGGKKVKTNTGFKDKSRALKFYFDLMEKVFLELNPNSTINLEDVISFLKSHPEAVSLNSDIAQKDWRS